MPAPIYEESVFINCPFDDDYKPIFEGLVFAIHDCGFVARSALEAADGSEVRIQKIKNIISSCKFGIHDISRTELDVENNLPRFNMPLELGLFLGAKEFGGRRQKEKSCLILERTRYRYQLYCSDIAGQDIRAHDGLPKRAIIATRDFLAAAKQGKALLPGGKRMAERYNVFRSEFPQICKELDLDDAEVQFFEYATIVSTWLSTHPW